MVENSSLCNILEMTRNRFCMTSLDLSLHSTQGTRILLLKGILVAWRRDYWTLIFLLKDLIT